MKHLTIDILSEEEIKKIHQTTLKILMDPGIAVGDPEARAIFKEHGCIVDDDTETVRIPEDVLMKALSTIPPEFTLYSRDGKHNVEWKSDGSVVNNNTFGIGSSVIVCLGKDKYICRPSTLEDLANLCKVLDYCDNIEFPTTPVSALDHADDPIRSLEEMRAMLYNTAKPLDFDSDSTFFKEYFEITKIIYGGDEKRAFNEPILTVAGCPTSPLMLDPELTTTCIHGPEYGFPLSMTSMAMAGASSPVHLAGTLAVHNAEVLSSLALAQMAHPGCKCIYGSATTIFDMKSGTVPVGCPEISMIGAAVASLTHFYHIPCMVAGGLSDAKRPCVQAGLEKAITVYTPIMGGPSTIFGAGMLNLASSQSMEQMLIDNEIIGQIRQIKKGIEVNDDTLAYDSIKKVGIGENFLAEPDTMKFIDMPSNPRYTDRGQFSDWESGGCKDMSEIVHEKVLDILSKPPLNPIPEDMRIKIDALLEKKRKEMES